MKKSFALIFALVMMIFITACGRNENGNSSAGSPPTEQNGKTFLIPLEKQLLPPAQEINDAEFEQAYKKFIEAVHNKDLNTLDGFLDNKIMTSFGGDAGKPYFYEYWNLGDNPEKSELWAELEKIIKLGGVYEKDEKRFTAPYIFKNFPDELDAFEYFVIIDEDVKIYEKDSTDSTIVGELDYNIVKFENNDEFWEMNGEGFIKITAFSGKEGYIQKKYIRSPIDYRFSLVREKAGEWKLAFLVAGD